jgi:hypothetical protein
VRLIGNAKLLLHGSDLQLLRGNGSDVQICQLDLAAA